MAETKIEWCDYTFNPWWGCQRVSPGCEHCYAEAWDKRVGGAHWGPGTERRTMSDAHWKEPLKWNRKAEKEGVRRKVFCASMADVFEMGEVQDEGRRRLQGIIANTPHLDWLLLTKRPENWAKVGAQIGWCFDGDRWYEPTGRIWVGVTAEDQKRADERIPVLLQIPAAVRFVSYEPALELISLRWMTPPGDWYNDQLQRGAVINEYDVAKMIDWIIIGGESGPGARLFDVSWARKTVDACKAAGVACFVKQLGSKPHFDEYTGGHFNIADKKGGNWDEWPERLRVREYPR